MTPTPAIDNEYATLIYYPDKKIIHHTFHKPIAGEEFRQILNRGIEIMAEKGACKWLSDDRGNIALPADDTEWSKTNWFPRAREAGWKFWALVVPQDLYARMNLKEFVDEYYRQGLRIMVFTDPLSALNWLERQW